MDSIVLPDNDSRCANVLRMMINNLNQKERENESRSAASSYRQGSGNQVYALRQKMFGSYLPSTKTDSRNASIVGELESTSTEPIRNKVFELRRVMLTGIRYSFLQ